MFLFDGVENVVVWHGCGFAVFLFGCGLWCPIVLSFDVVWCTGTVLWYGMLLLCCYALVVWS